MQYRFRYRPENQRGEEIFDLPAVADVAIQDDETVVHSLHLGGAEIIPSEDEEAAKRESNIYFHSMYWDMVDHMLKYHGDDIIRVLRIARVDRVTAALCAVGIYSTLAFQTLQIA